LHSGKTQAGSRHSPANFKNPCKINVVGGSDPAIYEFRKATGMAEISQKMADIGHAPIRFVGADRRSQLITVVHHG
jgi:hypothetical protein